MRADVLGSDMATMHDSLMCAARHEMGVNGDDEEIPAAAAACAYVVLE